MKPKLTDVPQETARQWPDDVALAIAAALISAGTNALEIEKREAQQSLQAKAPRKTKRER